MFGAKYSRVKFWIISISLFIPCVVVNAVVKELMISENVMDQVNNNTKKQEMIGGFSNVINDAVIDSLDAHQNLATQMLQKERVKKELADIVYELLLKGLKAS